MVEDEKGQVDIDMILDGLKLKMDSMELEKAVKIVGNQIKLSQIRFDEEWKLLLQEEQILQYENPSPSLKNLFEYIHEKIIPCKHSCNPEFINLNEFLSNVVQTFKRNVGREEVIFDELVLFFSNQGVLFPTPETEIVSDIHQSTVSLNLVQNENEETCRELWDKIRKIVCQGLLSTLDNMVPFMQILPEQLEINITKKIAILEKLSLLYTAKDLKKKYLQMRKYQLERIIPNANILGENCDIEGSNNMEDHIGCLDLANHALNVVFQEDFSIFTSQIFFDNAQMQHDEINTVYLQDFYQKLSEIVETQCALGKELKNDFTLSNNLVNILRQCLLSASLVDANAKKFLLSLKKSEVLQELSPSDIVQDEPEDFNAEHHIWPWQEVFKSTASKLSLAISEIILSVTKSALAEEMEVYKKRDHEYQMLHVPEILVRNLSDFPKVVSLSCALILTKIDELSTFLLLKSHWEFETVRNAFWEAIKTSLLLYKSRLSQMSCDVPRSSLVKNLYAVFNSAALIKMTLQQFEENNESALCSLMFVYNDLIVSLNEKILNYHRLTLSTVVLHDVHSHYWTNEKEFFEGERCSFSVQMWHYYMHGLNHDLWQMCSPKKCQEIFISIVHYSLTCFVRRYSKESPSYRRAKLFRSDITAILFSVSSWMIFPTLTSLTSILNPKSTESLIIDIHNSCSSLLAIMTIHMCPLQTLCLYASSGDDELIRKGKSTITSWLTWLQPQLYGEHTKRIVHLTDVQAINLSFKLMINQPSPVWSLVLQTVLLRDSYLPVAIVTNLDNDLLYDICSCSSKKSSVQFNSQNESLKTSESCFTIITSFYYVILKCANNWKSYVNFVIALMNRENAWKTFSTIKYLRLTQEDQIPLWLDCLYSTLKPFLSRWKKRMVFVLTSFYETQNKSFNFTKTLPCGCKVERHEHKFKKKGEMKISEAFEVILNDLVCTIPLMPKVVLRLFNRIEAERRQVKPNTDLRLAELRQVKPNTDLKPCAGIMIIGSLLYRYLCECTEDSLSKISPSFHDVIVNDYKTLNNLLYCVLVGERSQSFEESRQWRVIEILLKEKKDWIDEKIKELVKIMSEVENEECEHVSNDDNFEEHWFFMKSNEFLLDNAGKNALQKIYKFFVLEKEWILRHIPITSYLGPLLQPSASRKPCEHSEFNPYIAFHSLGGYSFNHDAIESFPFDCEKMLKSNIGVPFSSWKTFLYNRYDFQHESDLEPREKELVAKIKMFYEPG